MYGGLRDEIHRLEVGENHEPVSLFMAYQQSFFTAAAKAGSSLLVKPSPNCTWHSDQSLEKVVAGVVRELKESLKRAKTSCRNRRDA